MPVLSKQISNIGDDFTNARIAIISNSNDILDTLNYSQRIGCNWKTICHGSENIIKAGGTIWKKYQFFREIDTYFSFLLFCIIKKKDMKNITYRVWYLNSFWPIWSVHFVKLQFFFHIPEIDYIFIKHIYTGSPVIARFFGSMRNQCYEKFVLWEELLIS